DSTTLFVSVMREIAPDDVWAVGLTRVTGDLQEGVYHWDGARWTQVAHAIFESIAATPDGAVWFAGAAGLLGNGYFTTKRAGLARFVNGALTFVPIAAPPLDSVAFLNGELWAGGENGAWFRIAVP